MTKAMFRKMVDQFGASEKVKDILFGDPEKSTFNANFFWDEDEDELGDITQIYWDWINKAGEWVNHNGYIEFNDSQQLNRWAEIFNGLAEVAKWFEYNWKKINKAAGEE